MPVAVYQHPQALTLQRSASNMTIYINYRKIYEQHYGPIPMDEEGRSYEIHHIDGNHNNNEPSNLKAVSLQEHYDIHYKQGDFTSCLIMSKRMKISPEEKSFLARQDAINRVTNNTHHFLGGEQSRKNSQKMMEEGTHPFIGERNPVYKQLENRTLPLLGGKIQKETQIKLLNEGKHHSQKTFTCPHCGKMGKSNLMKRWHFDNCSNITGFKNKSSKKYL